ncbi:MAG TPA: hypothetical protein VF635_14640, partial [Propionibacteriaceae bacterium]
MSSFLAFARLREVPVGAALVVLVLVTYLVNPQFLSAQGIKDLLLNSTILLILAAGQTLVIITRNVDLSVGSILGLTAYATGTLYIYRGLNNAWAGGKQYFAGDRPDAFGELSVNTVLGVPIITLIALVIL